MAADAPPGLGFSRTPIAVVIDDQEWTRRSLQRILEEAGYGVLTAVAAEQAADVVARSDADVIFVHLDLPGPDGLEVIERLREGAYVDAATPIIALSRTRAPRERRLEALKRGAWYVLELPFDGDELVLRLRPMVAAKQAADDAREDSLVDHATGLYNVRGVLQKLSELRAAASRGARPLACVVVGPRAEPETPSAGAPPTVASPADAIGLRIREHADASIGRIWRATRRSDAKGALAPALYVVVAPDTDTAGAHILAERILSDADDPAVDWVAGLFAESDLEASSATASDYLSRATEAFRRAQGAEATRRILDYAPHTN